MRRFQNHYGMLRTFPKPPPVLIPYINETLVLENVTGNMGPHRQSHNCVDADFEQSLGVGVLILIRYRNHADSLLQHFS